MSVARLTRLALLQLALASIGPASRTEAAPPERLDARVVWIRAPWVYVAFHVQKSFEPGIVFTFSERGRERARAEVVATHGAVMTVARITEGSLSGFERKLDRLVVHAVDRPTVRFPILRLGYPSRARPIPLDACGPMYLVPPYGAYRVDTLTSHAYRLVRDTTSAHANSWPDTLQIRLFDEAADEEIALERGELDIGVFWPGEASTHIRRAMSWRERAGFRYGDRWMGAYLVSPRRGTDEEWSASSKSALRSLLSLSRDVFRGDLWVTCRGDSGSQAVPSDSVEFRVSDDLPGWQVLDAHLNRTRRGAAGLAPAPATIAIRPTRRAEFNDPSQLCILGLQPAVIHVPGLYGRMDLRALDVLGHLFRCDQSIEGESEP